MKSNDIGRSRRIQKYTNYRLYPNGIGSYAVDPEFDKMDSEKREILRTSKIYTPAEYAALHKKT